ncbi:hypothetical protein CONLIGDRAFT_687260 [Coniochaeta ligniaria NRRL 30616]|uniref:Uncharacterized protein n=1 Tax=Coniochaeta ligniaria NRRL 30616 TaxID=1408157 RepID=A0A1J7J5S9_9PEZI|nr:hypothetical protein CONLIGDRAFT_687260 [Coniochaeta ligniaria NRRL 30616]
MASPTESKQQRAVPRFEWDFDVPDTPFWKDVDMRVARNFITCYEPHQLEKIPFGDQSCLPEPDKLKFLLDELESQLAVHQAAVAPEKLHEADPVMWRRLLLGIETLQKHRNMPKEEAETIRIMLSTTEGDTRVPWLNMLADLDIRNGNFNEAESIAREVLPWMQKHEKLGVDSPQALGTTRSIINSMWKQGGGKVDEARRLVGETEALI